MKDHLFLGADIGGSHITVSAVDFQSRAVIEETVCRAPVDGHATAAHIVESWCRVFTSIIDRFPGREVKIGIAMPGPFDYANGVSFIKDQGKYNALYERNVKSLLAEQLQMPAGDIRFMNDAACFLLGEVFAGTAGNIDHAIGITLGTGIGSARYHKGVAEDADLWRMPFKAGIAEEYLATRWFVKRYAEITGNTVKDVKELISVPGSAHIVSQIFDEFSADLSAFLTHFIELDKPEVIIIGGNIAKASAYFFPQVMANLRKRGLQVPLVQAQAGEKAAMLGAASCWFEQNESISSIR